MSNIVAITSKQQLETLLSSSKIVVIDFWAEWCGPCKAMNPAYEELSKHLSRPQKVTFTKVNIDEQQEIAQTYRVTSIPTFKIFKNAQNVDTIIGADRGKLSNAVKKIAAEADGDGGEGGYGEASGSSSWLGASVARGFTDVTDQVDVRGLDLLNSDSAFASARDLFATAQPASLDGKNKDKKDWVESDTDPQLMLFMPFQSTLKIHSLLLTSLPPQDEDSPVTRPKTIRLYKNRAHTLGFDEAEDIEATQTIEIASNDWDSKTGTVKVELRYVKFQNITSIVVFVVDGENDDAEKTRLDRVRIIGESGEKRDMGKLEKIGDGSE